MTNIRELSEKYGMDEQSIGNVLYYYKRYVKDMDKWGGELAIRSFEEYLADYVKDLELDHVMSDVISVYMEV